MNQHEFKEFVQQYTQPAPLEIEAMRRAILEELNASSLGTTECTKTSALVRELCRRMVLNQSSIPLPEPYSGVHPDLNGLKAEITVREALQSLHASGALIAFGPLIDSDNPENHIRLPTIHNSSVASCSVYYPCVHYAYRLAIPFERGQSFRLASGDIYLSSLNQVYLPSRAKRCLKECIDAFRHGLYLSATMSIGAASESLWVRLGRLVCDKKPSASTKLSDQLKKFSPSISSVIDETWQVLLSNFTPQLNQVFSNNSERDILKKRAD